MRPGTNFIYVRDGIEYFATVISHDTNNSVTTISLLGESHTLKVNDSELEDFEIV